MEIHDWGDIQFDNEETKFMRAGHLHLWIRRRNDEIWIGHQYQEGLEDGRGSSDEKPPTSLEWARWAPKDSADTISAMPVFPDLPMVISSEYPLKVAPGSSITIYTRIPIWVRISIGKKGMVLTELPTVKLSRTWFGTPMEGELCYWSTTKARRSLEAVEKKAHLVSCPIRIINKTEEDLNFEKFCFRIERLKIFQYNEDLWADETHITYHGEEQHSDITMSGRLPSEMKNGELISAPRKPIQKSLATRTFRKIFDDSFLFGR